MDRYGTPRDEPYTSPMRVVRAVLTQGRGDADEWVTSYRVEFSSGGVVFSSVGTFAANSDRNTTVRNALPDGLGLTRYVRLQGLSIRPRVGRLVDRFVGGWVSGGVVD